MKNRIVSLIIFNIVCVLSIRATVWTTAADGFWNNPGAWVGNVVPPYSSSDTFDIRNYIAIENNLSFNTGSKLLIDSTGGICGHHNVSINANVPFDKYGILELDTLFVNSGHVECYPPGQVVLTCYGVIWGAGAYLNVHGSGLSVGPWFKCVEPEFNFMPNRIEEINENNVFILVPNPNSGAFVLLLKRHLSDGYICLMDLTGRVILKQSIGKTTEQSFDIKEIAPGIYLLSLFEDGKRIGMKKMIVE